MFLRLLTSLTTLSLLAACSSPADQAGGDDAPADGKVDDGTRPALEPNDVSILFSLPRGSAEVASFLYLMPSNSIFPAGLENELPSLFSTAPGTPSQLYQAMQIVAFRFVPCAATSTTCKPQVRLAAQYVVPGTGNDYAMDEVALHLFYDLDAGEPEELARALLTLKQASPAPTAGEPLFVHPALANGGMTGAWGEQLRTVVQRFARKEKLVRVTSMGFVFDSWPFRDTKVADGHVVEETPLQHLETPDVVQSWDIFGDGDRIGNLSPASSVESGPAWLAVQSRYTSAPAAELRAAVDSVERTLNPERHTPESVDCASCHIARFTKVRAVAAGVDFTSSNSYVPPSWANTERVTDPAIDRAAANIVQFGYFLRLSQNEGLPEGKPLPSVSERVIHDSIEAAKLASALLD